jgi:hypothetical protein
MSASIPLFNTFTRCPKQASASPGVSGLAVTVFSGGLLTSRIYARSAVSHRSLLLLRVRPTASLVDACIAAAEAPASPELLERLTPSSKR